MLVIRMQRTGRKGHAQFRVVVQDSRRTPSSGRIVAALGSFNPHTKQTTLDKEKAALYLTNGAQPSERVTRLLKNEGVKLPAWVKVPADKSRTVRHPEKLRKNQPEKPAEEAVEAPAEVAEETAAEAPEAEAPAEETPAEPTAEVTAEESPAEPVSE
jgi:small subunit ribosomal protein S16